MSQKTTEKAIAIAASTALLTLPAALPVITSNGLSVEKAYAAEKHWEPKDIMLYGPAEPVENNNNNNNDILPLVIGGLVGGTAGVVVAATATGNAKKRKEEQSTEEDEQNHNNDE